MELTFEDEKLLHKLEFEAGTTNRNILSDLEWKRARKLVTLIADRKVYHDADVRDADTSQCRRLRIALSPQKLLPPEVLTEVFALTLLGDVVQFPPRFSTVPWVLYRVCSSWTAVARKEPRLWARIHIGKTVSTPKHFEFIDKLLPPSGPLSISLESQSLAHGFPIVDRLIIPNLPRMKNLLLHLPACAYWEVWKLPPEAFASVESAGFKVYHDFYGHDAEALETNGSMVFSGARRLKQLKFSSPHCRDVGTLLNMHVPWRQLVYLDLSEVWFLDLTAMHRILQQCSLLEKLSIRVTDMHNTTVSTNDRVHLLHLRSFTLAGRPDEASETFLHLTIPWGQLTELSFMAQGWGHFQTYPILQKCVGLEDLVFDADWNAQSDALPTGVILMQFLRSLTLPIGARGILPFLVAPALTSLHIRDPGTLSPDGMQFPLQEILEICLQSGCSLHSLKYDARIPRNVSHLIEQGKTATLRALLEALSTVVSFIAPHLLFETPVLTSIANGALLPQLRHLAVQVQSPVAFVDMVQTRNVRRSPEVSAGLLRDAHGYYVPRPPPVGLGSAKIRLATLNAEHGMWCTLRPLPNDGTRY